MSEPRLQRAQESAADAHREVLRLVRAVLRYSTLIAAHRFGRAGVRLRVAITCRTFLARRMQGCHIGAIDFGKRFRGRLGRPL